MKRFSDYLSERSDPLPRSKQVKIRAFDGRHKTPNALTVMFAKHTGYKRGDESFDFTIKEPTGTRKYHGTVAKLKDTKGRSKQGWIAGVEGKRGKKTETGVGTTTSRNDLIAIRKAYELAAKALGQAARKNIPMITRGDALAKRI